MLHLDTLLPQVTPEDNKHVKYEQCKKKKEENNKTKRDEEEEEKLRGKYKASHADTLGQGRQQHQGQ